MQMIFMYSFLFLLVFGIFAKVKIHSYTSDLQWTISTPISAWTPPQGHVKVSFEEPEYTAQADGVGTLRLLEAILGTMGKIRWCQKQDFQPQVFLASSPRYCWWNWQTFVESPWTAEFFFGVCSEIWKGLWFMNIYNMIHYS